VVAKRSRSGISAVAELLVILYVCISCVMPLWRNYQSVGIVNGTSTDRNARQIDNIAPTDRRGHKRLNSEDSTDRVRCGNKDCYNTIAG